MDDCNLPQALRGKDTWATSDTLQAIDWAQHGWTFQGILSVRCLCLGIFGVLLLCREQVFYDIVEFDVDIDEWAFDERLVKAETANRLTANARWVPQLVPESASTWRVGKSNRALCGL
jgi:hypothetical protein